ncbi:di-trans,poly-cis-decaprenylcistransferase [Candidatus Parcubacteria bacterium]|nr:di-trans,poly-cis-decaprenylcistransferase [Candidatus Parcubacteria bacterium]
MNKNTKLILPKHIGILVEGSDKWAKERNLSLIDGCSASYVKIKMVPAWFFSKGIKIVTMFVFGGKIWNSNRDDVNKLMKLTRQILDIGVEKFNKEGYKVVFSGRINELPGDLPELCFDIVNKTKNNQNGTLNICLNYDSKIEILDAVRKMFKNNISFEQIHEGMLNKYLYHGELGNFDLLIQTAGKSNIEGFNLWQMDSAELIFLNKLWPDFEKQDVDVVLSEYDKIKKII